MKRLLVTGGAGFIGSHCCLILLEAGYDLVVLDNFDNSCPEALNRVQLMAGRQLKLVEGDIRDLSCVNNIFKDTSKSANRAVFILQDVVVGESANPLLYWDVNVSGSRNLLSAMHSNIVGLVFSSIAQFTVILMSFL